MNGDSWVPTCWNNGRASKALIDLIDSASKDTPPDWAFLFRTHLESEIRRLEVDALDAPVETVEGQRRFHEAKGGIQALKQLVGGIEWGCGSKIDRAVEERRLDTVDPKRLMHGEGNT